MQKPRFAELEALRGIAALIVLVHHCLLGFAPQLHGLVTPLAPYSLFGTPVFALVNGSAAVVLFFVLSGFVLTIGIVQSRDLRRISVSAIKRLPRLALPVVAVNILSALLLVGGFYRNMEVAPLTGSPWLGWFFGWPPNWRDLPAAITEGAATTFFLNRSAYNASLWTMYHEFWGSFLVLLLAMAFVLSGRSRWWGACSVRRSALRLQPRATWQRLLSESPFQARLTEYANSLYPIPLLPPCSSARSC